MEMITHEERTALASNRLELPCGLIHLWKGAQSKEEGHAGPGYIRQLESGKLELTVFIERNAPSLESIWNHSGKTGELYTDPDFYSIEAHDFAGRTWTASRVLPSFPGFHGPEREFSMAKATLKEIHAQESNPFATAKPQLDLWYLGDLEFPFNRAVRSHDHVGEITLRESVSRQAAEFTCVGCDFLVWNEPPFLRVAASSTEGPLSPNLEFRFSEALEFLLARRLSWSCVVKHEGPERWVKVKDAPRVQAAGRMQEPVSFTADPGHHDDALMLLHRYLTKIAMHQGEGLPPISLAVRSVLAVAALPLDANALGLAVAVESMLSEEFGHLGKADKQTKEEAKRIRRTLEDLDLSVRMKNRVVGLFSVLTQPDPRQRLRELEELGVTDPSEHEAWKRIRNDLAHGTFIKEVDQEYLDRFGKLQMLFYRLIFASVGYEGPYRNYGHIGWPWQRADGGDSV